MKSTSPPASVQARPVTTPGRRGPERHLFLEPRRAQVVVHLGHVHHHRLGRRGVGGAGGDPGRDFPGDGPQLALEVPDARLPRVLGDHGPQRRLGQRHHFRRQPVLAHLPRKEVDAGDVQLLFLAVSGQRDDLHPVEQRRMHRPQLVGRGDEQHLRQVHRRFQVVVAERVVLRRVQHLEQRRGRVALEAGGHLVDLVEHEHRVHRARLLEAPGRCGRESSRCRCGGGRESRPRRARRPARCARTSAPSRGRSTGPATSCRRRAGPTKHRMGPFMSPFILRTARYSTIRSFTLSRS